MRECYDLTHNKVVWALLFRRELEDWMVDGWVSLLSLLNNIFVVGRGKDRRIWELDSHDFFL